MWLFVNSAVINNSKVNKARSVKPRTHRLLLHEPHWFSCSRSICEDWMAESSTGLSWFSPYFRQQCLPFYGRSWSQAETLAATCRTLWPSSAAYWQELWWEQSARRCDEGRCRPTRWSARFYQDPYCVPICSQDHCFAGIVSATPQRCHIETEFHRSTSIQPSHISLSSLSTISLSLQPCIVTAGLVSEREYGCIRSLTH